MNNIEIHRFSNGLTLVLEKLPECRSAGLAVAYPAGGRTEKIQLSGISHYLEHMIFKGTKTVKNVDAAFQRVGANINAFTDVDSTVYLAECPRESAIKALDLYLRFLGEALIDKEEFERERGVILSEYFITEDSPDFLVEKNTTLSLFRGHPLSSTVIGTDNTIKAISHQDMLNYFHTWYAPANAVIWVSGNLTVNQLIDCIEEQENWTEHGTTHPASYKAFRPQGPVVVELRRGIKLVQVGLALSSPTDSVEERASLQILASLFSAGRSSILRQRLVLEDKFTDMIRTIAPAFREAGMLFVTFATKPSNVPRVLKILTKSVVSLRQDSTKFREDFENAKNHAMGSFSTGIDMRMMRRALQGSLEMLRRGHCSWDELTSSLESHSLGEFQGNVAEITQPDRVSLILAGDIKKGTAKTAQW
jgi:predicted Zn-dependent peptidase